MKIVLMIVQLLFGIFIIGFLWAHYTNRKIPWVTDDKSAFIALGVFGLILCTLKITIRVFTSPQFLNTFTVLAGILGTLALLLVIVLAAGKTISFITNYNTAFNVLALLIGIKWLMGFFNTLTQQS